MEYLPARILLSRFRLPDDSLRHKLFASGLPVYYRLGRELMPRRLACCGGHFGLEAACCALGAKSEKVALFNQDEPRFANANVKLAGAKLGGEDWDLALDIGGDHTATLWEGVVFDGALCVVNNDEAAKQFGQVKNRKVEFIKGSDSLALIRK